MYDFKTGDLIGKKHPTNNQIIQIGIVIKDSVSSFIVQWTSYNKDFFMEKEGDIFMEELTTVEKRLKLAVRQMSGTLTEDDTTLLPEAAIIGTGVIFCYSPSKRRFINILRGIKVFVIDDSTINEDRVLIYTTDGFLVEIERRELLHTRYD